MEKALYEFNSSQDIIHLQTKHTLFKRVQNILFYTIVDNGFDPELMIKAINKIFERNDSLRIRFIKKDRKILQYFEDKREIGDIPYKEFKTEDLFIKFMNRFRRKSTNCFTGEVLKVVFAKNQDGKQMIIFKISHYVADTYGIGIIVNDLFTVYNAMKDGNELPPMPGSFEEVLKKDMIFRNDEQAKDKDREFYKDLYFNKHPEHATYCGIHGNRCKLWLKSKNKGNFHIPYLFFTCHTKGYRFVIPSALTEKVAKWCEETGNTMSAFFMYCYAIGTSLLNDREKYQLPLELLNSRATLTERKAAGTKVQSIAVFIQIDYQKNFNDNIAVLKEEQTQIYRHTKLSYLEVERIYHDAWKFTMLGQLFPFCYSFIPMSTPEGVTLQVYSNGKGSLVDYLALIYDINTKEINMVYDVQTRMITPEILIDFQNLYIQIIEKVLENPTMKLEELF